MTLLGRPTCRTSRVILVVLRALRSKRGSVSCFSFTPVDEYSCKHNATVSVWAAVDQGLSDRIAKAIGHPPVKPLKVKPAIEAVKFRALLGAAHKQVGIPRLYNCHLPNSFLNHLVSVGSQVMFEKRLQRSQRLYQDSCNNYGIETTRYKNKWKNV